MSGCDAAAFAKAARALIGTPFRLRGRSPPHGIDCVGLVYCALSAIGRRPPALPHYSLRNTDFDCFFPLLEKAGFIQSCPSSEVGDLLLFRPSPAQYHLAILDVRDRIIHAHAGLGRVVSTPLSANETLIARWRLTKER